MKKLFSEIPCLQGEGLALRKPTLSDASGLRELTESAGLPLSSDVSFLKKSMRTPKTLSAVCMTKD